VVLLEVLLTSSREVLFSRSSNTSQGGGCSKQAVNEVDAERDRATDRDWFKTCVTMNIGAYHSGAYGFVI
jgi:hypothetical protein